MKIYNKSSRDQKFRIKDRYGNLYVVYIKAGRSTELEPSQVSEDVLNLISQGVLKDVTDDTVVSHTTPIKVTPVNDSKDKPAVDIECACVEETKEDVDKVNNSVEESNDQTTEIEEPTVQASEDSSDVYVCPICGKEYATQRGLTMHTNKEHKSE